MTTICMHGRRRELLDSLCYVANPMSKGNNVQLSTFRSWKVDEKIGHRLERRDGKELVVQVYCKFCAKHSDVIQCNAKLRGRAKVDALKFVEGSD